MGASRILHVDMDSFFVSVELLRNPSLRGKPVAVGDAGPRGVVASASYEARRFGVRSAMPSARARVLCPRLVFLPGSHGVYEEWSLRVREILGRYSPTVEAASIDEFYLDLAGCERLHGNFLAMAGRLAEGIRDRLGLPASAGLAANRTLAKIASKVAKPRGVLEVLAGGEASFMAPLPAGLIPGVGPALAGTLSRMGVRTAGELAAVPPALLEGVVGACARELHLKARGTWRGDPVAAEEGPRLPKSVGHETTFDEDSTDPAFLEATLFTLTERAAVRLRKKGLEARRVAVRVRYSDFVTATRAAPLEPSNLERDLFRAGFPLLRSLLERRMRVRLVGVSCSALRPTGWQENLFRQGDVRRREACQSLDRIKARFGFDALRWATGVAG